MRPRNRTGASSSVASFSQAVAVSAASRDHEHQVGSCQPKAGDRADGGVEALARDEPRDADDDLGVDRDPEVLAGSGALVVCQGAELVGVHTAGHDGDRQLPSRRVFTLGRRVPTGGDDLAGATQRVGQRLLGSGEPTGHRDLGAVQHEVVRKLQRRPDQTERHGGVDHDEVGAEVLGQFVDLMNHPGMRKQHRLAGALDAVRLAGVELGRARVRAGEHRERFGRQPAPPLPQQRLDPADLRWKVVRDQQVLHAWARSSSRAAAQTACSARIGSMPER